MEKLKLITQTDWKAATEHLIKEPEQDLRETPKAQPESETVIFRRYFESIHQDLDPEKCRYRLKLSAQGKIRRAAMKGRSSYIFSYHAVKKAIQRIIEAQKD